MILRIPAFVGYYILHLFSLTKTSNISSSFTYKNLNFIWILFNSYFSNVLYSLFFCNLIITYHLHFSICFWNRILPFYNKPKLWKQIIRSYKMKWYFEVYSLMFFTNLWKINIVCLKINFFNTDERIFIYFLDLLKVYIFYNWCFLIF